LVDYNYPTKEITLLIYLEAIALSITLLYVTLTVFNIYIYIPHQKDFTLYDIEHIIQQLLNTFIIVFDFNSHSELGVRRRLILMVK